VERLNKSFFVSYHKIVFLIDIGLLVETAKHHLSLSKKTIKFEKIL
jgi:hypothetical protein